MEHWWFLPQRSSMESICDKFRFQHQAKLSGKASLALAPNSPQLHLILEKNTCNKIEQTHRRKQCTIKWMEEVKKRATRQFPGWVISHSTQKSSCRAEHSGYHVIYINPRTILAHDNHEVINVINSNNVSVWEYKTWLWSGYFHTH